MEMGNWDYQQNIKMHRKFIYIKRYTDREVASLGLIKSINLSVHFEYLIPGAANKPINSIGNCRKLIF